METLEGSHLVVGLNKPERKGYSRTVLTKLKTKPQNDPANLKYSNSTRARVKKFQRKTIKSRHSNTYKSQCTISSKKKKLLDVKNQKSVTLNQRKNK